MGSEDLGEVAVHGLGQEITITSFVREFYGQDAHIECSMVDEAGKLVSRCLMIVTCIDKGTNRAMDWPIDTMVLFFENGTDWVV